MSGHVDAATPLVDVVGRSEFAGFGTFLVPSGGGEIDRSDMVADLGRFMPYHQDVNTRTSVDVINALLDAVDGGQTVFYDIYSAADKAADPSKEDTGLFFFRGNPGAPFAIASAGGGFSYVASLHESLPVALDLSRRGYNSFAIQYRTGGADVAYKDLAAAIGTVFDHADEWGVGTDGYSLWGASAGARMAASLGANGAAAYGGEDLPLPSAVVLQYTGFSMVESSEPPTFAVVGDNDGIANWRVMKDRLDTIAARGVDTEFRLCSGVGHGFGLGLGTEAEGWIDDAVAFWERQAP
ncbi:MAG: alpha/beta hydrolase [Cellulomonadaceae bacterium]|nr:alpha/beta hydrolase [Cellulomonadaceae bacterium]